MESNIFLENYYNCELEEKLQRTSQNINCKFWSVDNKCKTNCSLKIFDNPDPLQCLSCEKREPIVFLTVKNTEKVNTPSTIQKTINYTKAESSQLISGKVSKKTFNQRKNICLSCELRVNPKPELDSIGWCKGGCGCTIGNPRAGLTQKLNMPNVSCPKNKWGPEKGEGFNISDTIDSIKGIATSIKNLFEKDK